MNRNRGRGGGRPQGRGGGMMGNRQGRQRPEPVNAGAGILGMGPSMIGIGGNDRQFKQPPPMSPPSGRMQNMSSGMQGMMQGQQNKMLGSSQGSQMPSVSRESQLQMMNNLLMKQQQQQQQINTGRANLLSNSLDGNDYLGNRSNLLGTGSQGDNRRNLTGDMGNDNMSSVLGLSQSFGRSLLDESMQDSLRDRRRNHSIDDIGLTGRSSFLGDSVGQSSILHDNRGGRSSLDQNLNRGSLRRDDMHRGGITSSAGGILDAAMSNMDQAIFGQSNQLQRDGSNLQMGKQRGNIPRMMGNQGGSMQGLMESPGSGMQGMMGNQGTSMQDIMGNQGSNMQSMMGGQGSGMQGMMGNQGSSMQGMIESRGNSMQGIMGIQGRSIQQGGNMQGILGQGQGRPNQNQGPGNNPAGLLGPRPQMGGQSSIPSLFDVKPNQRSLLGKRTGRGGRDQNGEKRFRRNSGPLPQDTRRFGNRNDRSSDGRGRGRDRRNDRPRRSSSKDRRNRHDSDASRKAHSSDRKSNVRSKSHDKSADKKGQDDKAAKAQDKKGQDDKAVKAPEKKEQYDPAQPTDDDEHEAAGLAWIEKKTEDVEMIDLAAESKKTDTKETKATPQKDLDVMGKTVLVTIDSKGRIVDDSALGFARHMKGKRHLSRMESLGSAHQHALEHQVVRIKAEEHLRTMERKPRTDDRRRDSSPRQGSNDRRSNRSSRRRNDRDLDESSNASFPGDLGDMVTVDEIGFEDQEQDDFSMETDGANQNTKDESKHEKKVPLPEDADDYIIPDFDPKNPVGQNYVVPVSGYFCKLCHKFYATETAAKTNHCQSKQHYDKFNALVMQKQMAKALSKTEEEEKDSTGNNVEVKNDMKSEENSEKNTDKVESIQLNGTAKDQTETVKDEVPTDSTTVDDIKTEAEENITETESTEKIADESMEDKTEEESKETKEAPVQEEIQVTVSNNKAKAVKKVASKARRGKKI